MDPLLKADGIERLVVHGTDADLAAVVLRLMRIERVTELPVGYVPVDRKQSAVARLWGLPARTVDTALTGSVRPFPLVRDDAGGVLVGLGVLPAVRGTVYCDDTVALRGAADRIEVVPHADEGVEVTVARRGLVRSRTAVFTGRAVQFGVDAAVPVRDGVEYPRAMTRWTWYRHTEDLLTIR